MGRTRGGVFGRRQKFRTFWETIRFDTDEEDDSDEDLNVTQGFLSQTQASDDTDDEICFGTLRGNIVGIQYYRGTVNNNEMVALEREPHNKYDINAIKVNNVAGIQVGHIKRELARPLAYILDKGLARLEGVVPFGQTNVYAMPVDLTMWGKPEHQRAAVDKMKYHGFYLTNGTVQSGPNKLGTSTSQESASLAYADMSLGRTYLSSAEVKDQLDNLFEKIEEGDKTTLAEPAKAICTEMYPHQKQALNWMIMRENTQALPPFWVERNKRYFNNILNFTTDKRPESVKGGILADDMGLGKTLEVISLILTNFVDKQPLAVPVLGLVRQNRRDQMALNKAKVLPTCSSIKGDHSRKKVELKLEPNTSYITEEKSFPELPKLEEDSDIATPEVSDNDDDVIILDDKVMTTKDDPNFSPLISKGKIKQETKVASPLTTRRPKRNAKRPAKYAYSSEEDELMNNATPKKAKLEPVSGRGKGMAKGPKRGKKTKSKVMVAVQESATVTQRNPDPTDCSGRVPLKDVNKENLPDLPALQDKLIVTDIIKGTIKDELPELENACVDSNKVIKTEDSDNVVCPDYSKPNTSGTDSSTGRTPTTGPRCTLIVCPMSVLSNWLDQFEMHVHRNVHLNIYLYYGSQRTKKSADLETQDVVVTTYSTVAADYKKGGRNPLKKVKWLRVVLDEGHAIKNPNALQTKAICELETERKWVLTGTPIQNSMKDLWSLINFLKVNPFTNRQWWRRTIERPLTAGNQAALKRLQHLMSNISMRRTKTQQVNGKPLVDLPGRHVYVQHVKFTTEERAVYEAMQKDGKLIVSKYFRQGTLLHNYGDVLAILMRLRQLCCHPFLVAKAAQAVKDTMANLEESGGEVNDELRQKLINTLMMVLSAGSDEECAICLESLNSPVITSCAHVFCRQCIEAVIKNEKPQSRCPLCRGDIDEDKLLEVPPAGQEGQDLTANKCTSDTWKPSAKIDALMDGLLKVRAEDSRTKSIVVSQFTSLLTLLEIPLKASGFTFTRLDGTMNTKARMEAIEDFSSQAPDSPTIILLSLKAGGVGINLTAATRVFLIDPAWNPASEEQCFDRCHRLGQKKDVVITKFIVEDSVEERMMELQEKKRKLMKGAFGKKQSAEQKRQDRIKDIKTLLSF